LPRPLKITPTTVRLDRWLNAARFYKTRSKAARACDGRKVKVNGRTAKPHKFIHVGDRLTIHHYDRYRNLEVLALAERGLPAVEAQKLYREEPTDHLTESDRELMAMVRSAEKKHKGRYKGRPTKKERRQLDKSRGFGSGI
jgi:ribosome-associated heat shock protein Hsp15